MATIKIDFEVDESSYKKISEKIASLNNPTACKTALLLSIIEKIRVDRLQDIEQTFDRLWEKVDPPVIRPIRSIGFGDGLRNRESV